MQALYLGAVLAVGAGVMLQGVINARLGHHLNHPLQASLVSFTVGLLTLAVINLAVRAPLPPLSTVRAIPPYLWVGGMIGAVFVSSAIVFIPRLGATVFGAAAIAGQLVAAVVVDHFGILGVPVTRFNLARLAGVALIAAGFYLVRR